MRKSVHLSVIIILIELLPAFVFGQMNLQNLLNLAKPPKAASIQSSLLTANGGCSSQLTQFFRWEKNSKSFYPDIKARRNLKRAGVYPDTLIIGVSPYDTLTITGTLVHNGPIFVALNGLLIIKHANLTNLGDLDVFNSGKVIIDSSTVSFPQSYFYQRSLMLLNKANVSISNSTLNYGGLSHNWLITDTASLSLYNDVESDWATTGLSYHGAININKTSEVGEIIIDDYTTLNLKNATTALLWHHIPDSANISWSFGTHDTAYGYLFNNTLPGVHGIEYHVTADSVYNVMWALMPSSGSNIVINNSKIRAIGAWFDKPADSVNVSGITDNANYSNFTAPLSDRILSFTNCTVKTWSFYVFHKSVINVTGCIAGEIGAENSSKIYGNDYVVDGSGGYHWTTDTATAFTDNATVYSYVRSEKNSIFLFAYGNIGNGGGASAIDNSLLIVVQSIMPSVPTALAGSDAEFDNINQPGMLFADSVAPVYGSAWIHRGPTSNWMYFKSWQLFYHAIDSSNWIPIAAADTNPVSNNLLANWSTHTLAAGNYALDLRLTDTWNNNADAVLDVTLYPPILGLKEMSALSGITIYPNPAHNEFNVSVHSPVAQNAIVELDNLAGQCLLKVNPELSTGNNLVTINTAGISAGEYICRIITQGGVSVQNLVIDK